MTAPVSTRDKLIDEYVERDFMWMISVPVAFFCGCFVLYGAYASTDLQWAAVAFSCVFFFLSGYGFVNRHGLSILCYENHLVTKTRRARTYNLSYQDVLAIKQPRLACDGNGTCRIRLKTTQFSEFVTRSIDSYDILELIAKKAGIPFEVPPLRTSWKKSKQNLSENTGSSGAEADEDVEEYKESGLG